MHHENHRCAICAAEFASSADLVRHERAEHTHHGTGTNPAGDQGDTQASTKPREGREFTRRNLE